MTEAFASAGIATAAGLLLIAVKRAAIGSRSLVQAVVCWLDGGRHVPKREPLGFRCAYCDATTNDLGDWGYPGYVSPLTRVYEREHGSIERSDW